MSRKYYLKEKYHKKLSYFLLCQMKIMIAVSLAVVGMNGLLTNVHAETETYGIYKNDNNVYECEVGGNSVRNKIDVKDVTYLYIAADVTEIVNVKKSYDDEPKVHTVHFLGNNVQTIGNGSFYNFVYLEKISRLEYQSNLTEIGNYVFANTKITSIQLPTSVNFIGSDTFNYCSKLETIIVNDANTTYYSHDGILFKKENGADKETLLRYPEGKTGNDYTIPNGVEIIDENSFYNVSHLKNVTIPTSVTVIKKSSFENAKVEKVLFENGSQLRQIEEYAFCWSMLNEIILPEKLYKIGEHVFSSTQLTTVNIPHSVTNIEGSPFFNCPNMTAINVAENNQNYQSIDGVLYTNNGEKLLSYPTAKSINTYTVEDGVNIIGKWAFSYSKNTPYVVIPNSVNHVEDDAFRGSLIKGILFEGTLPTFGSNVFYNANTDLKLYTLNSNDANANDGLELYKAPILTVENSLVGKVGESYPIQARLNADATFRDTIDYTYTSTDSNVASVNQLGIVEMNEAGKANIKVTASDPFRQAEETIIVNVEEEVIDEDNQETPPTDPDSGETPNQPGNDNNNPGQLEDNVTPSQPGTDNNPSQPESNVTPSQPTIKPQENQKEPESSNQVKTSDETMIIGMIGMLLLGGIGILSLRRKES